MIRKILYVLILIPLAIILIALMVANRSVVPLSLDVFNPSNPDLTLNAPLFIWLFGSAAIGIVVGGIGSWFAQGKHRKLERKFKKEAQELRYEMEVNRSELKTSDSKALVMQNR
ncbi:MAG: LapA family protein [Ahrensia sp.]|nr:LapA family protein [Ahrensia sp.]